jgi:hypothetical protein
MSSKVPHSKIFLTHSKKGVFDTNSVYSAETKDTYSILPDFSISNLNKPNTLISFSSFLQSKEIALDINNMPEDSKEMNISERSKENSSYLFFPTSPVLHCKELQEELSDFRLC